MKLKYKFVTRSIDGRVVAVAVGCDNARFNGMIKLNETGEFVFGMLSCDTTEDEIVTALAEKYGITAEEAMEDVVTFV